MGDATGPVAAFARDLRVLRNRAGNPSYRELARKALFAPSVLSSAASGHRLPTLPVTLAFVTACGGDRVTWERRWRTVAEAARSVKPREERPPEPALDTGRRPMLRPVSTPARPAQLPMGSGTFVGRRHELADAVKAVGPANPVKTPLMISGPIGVGKTAFALRLADELAGEFPDGQLYADLGAEAQSWHDVIRGFLRALGVPATLIPDDPMQRVGLYRSLLAERRLYVLLENADDERKVRPLLGRATRSLVVVSSRARLLGLDGAHRIDLGVFARDESVELLGRLAGAQRVATEREASAKLAELCGDLPLAVNIIGRKIAARPEWAVSYTAALLGDRGRLLDNLSVGDVNVRDRFSSAYQRLSPAGRLAIDRLGLAGERWTTAISLAAALGIHVDVADDVLESLVDTGLLTRSAVPGRYSVSTLAGAFAAGARRDAESGTVRLVERRRMQRRSGDRAASDV